MTYISLNLCFIRSEMVPMGMGAGIFAPLGSCSSCFYVMTFLWILIHFLIMSRKSQRHFAIKIQILIIINQIYGRKLLTQILACIIGMDPSFVTTLCAIRY